MITLYGSDLSAQAQRIGLTSRGVPVAVYGLGKMGLPLAAALAETTGNVTGVDTDPTVARTVDAGGCHVEGEPGLDELVAERVDQGALRATTDATGAAEAASLHVVIVPTLLTDDREPDLSMLQAAVESIGAGLAPGDVVVVESTVPPGTCAEVVEPLLAAESGLSTDMFGVACCPERTSSGRALRDIRGAYPRVVGGTDEEATRVAELVYDSLTANEVIAITDATTAESVKVFEGLYRDVNIALANELARCRDDLGIDVREAIDAANTQPFCDIHTPGPGVGGHCIPFYPYFLMDRVAADTPLLRTAREVNDSMPAFVVDQLAEAMGPTDDRLTVDGGRALADSTVLVLGLTYRAGVEETRASPARGVIERLDELGADVLAADPLVDEAAAFGATPVAIDEIPAHDLDGAVLVTAHPEFDHLDWDAVDDDVPVVDGRGVLSGLDQPVYTVGRG